MSRVALVQCPSYDPSVVQAAFAAAVDLLGGLPEVVTPGERILLKPNVLVGDKPEKAVTTHPEVLRAVGAWLVERGAVLHVGDSPGFGQGPSALRKAGLARVAEELGATVDDFRASEEVVFPDSPFTKRFRIVRAALDAGGIVSACKMKTHELERVTGAVKNTFGCVPGAHKAEHHVKIPDPWAFGRMLVSLGLFLRPRLYVMDAVIAMEGNGPRSGDPRHVGALLASTDPVALDATMCRLMHMDPAIVPTNVYGQQDGLGTWEEVEVVGEPLAALAVPDFDCVREAPERVEPGSRAAWMKNRLAPRPVIHDDECVRCGICHEVCPVQPKALEWPVRARPPVYEYGRCIRCYCCQELCPERAISVVRPLLGRLLFTGTT